MSTNQNQLNAPRTKKEIEESYASILAPYAVVTGERQDKSEEDDQDNRAVFQRDRDRIIHSEAFRRLMYKTQVFVNHEGDGYRTRLTHTLEVSQLARGICKSLALNEDLAEAIALGHDLGHTPFGHAIEEFFDEELKEKKLGRFFHNEQSIRVVEYLEKRRKDKIGLNLSREVREGILKHTCRRSGAFEHLEPWAECSHLEGQIVSLVDTIAYTCHDLDDAIKSGIVSRSMAQNKDFKDNLMQVANRLEAEAGLKESNVSINFEPYDNTYFTRYIIHYFITDLTQNIFKNIKTYSIQKLSHVREQGENGNVIVSLSDNVKDLFSSLKKFITQYIYHSQTVSLMDEKAVSVVRDMYYKLMERPSLLPPDWLYRYEHIDSSANISGIKNDRARVVCDYISCMTDRSALEEHDRLFDPKIKL